MTESTTLRLTDTELELVKLALSDLADHVARGTATVETRFLTRDIEGDTQRLMAKLRRAGQS